MKNNSGHPSTPSALFSARLRLNSYNSPFISPLRLAQSPFLHESNFLDGNHAQVDFNHFQLEENPPMLEEEEQINEDEREEESLPPPLPTPQQEHDDDIILDEKYINLTQQHAGVHPQQLPHPEENGAGSGGVGGLRVAVLGEPV